MRLFVVPVDVLGKLWWIHPGEAPARGAVSEGRADLHVTRVADVDAAVVGTLWAGRSIALVESAPTLEARLSRVTARLAELGQPVECRRAEPTSSGSFARIEDEGAALAWFLRDAADVLVLDGVTFEKRRRHASQPIRTARAS